MKVALEIFDASAYPEGASELLWDVFVGSEVTDAFYGSGRERRVAVAGDTVVGFLAFRRILTYQYWELSWLATSGEFRRLGVGRALVDYLKAIVVLAGGSYIRLETPELSEARAFYESCGFEHVATLPEFYEPDAGSCLYVWKNPNYRTIEIPDDD